MLMLSLGATMFSSESGLKINLKILSDLSLLFTKADIVSDCMIKGCGGKIVKISVFFFSAGGKSGLLLEEHGSTEDCFCNICQQYFSWPEVLRYNIISVEKKMLLEKHKKQIKAVSKIEKAKATKKKSKHPK